MLIRISRPISPLPSFLTGRRIIQQAPPKCKTVSHSRPKIQPHGLHFRHLRKGDAVQRLTANSSFVPDEVVSEIWGRQLTALRRHGCCLRQPYQGLWGKSRNNSRTAVESVVVYCDGTTLIWRCMNLKDRINATAQMHDSKLPIPDLAVKIGKDLSDKHFSSHVIIF